MWQHLPLLHTASIQWSSSDCSHTGYLYHDAFTLVSRNSIYASRNVLDVHIHVLCMQRADRELHCTTDPISHVLACTSAQSHSRSHFRRLCSRTGPPTSVFRRDASSHSCLPLIHSSCISTLRRSAVVSLTYLTPLPFQDPS